MDNNDREPIEIAGVHLSEDELLSLNAFLDHSGSVYYNRICSEIRRGNIDSTIGNIAVEKESEFYRAQGFERAFVLQEQIREAVKELVSQVIQNNS